MAITFYHPEWGAQRPIRGILFDMDGLVLDTEKLYTRFWMEAIRYYGFSITLEQALGLRSLGKEPGQAHLTACCGAGIDYTIIREKRIERMNAYIEEYGIDPKPGIYELMDYLDAAGIPSAITSSSPMANIRRHLTSQNLCHRFTRLCSGHEVPQGKPAPDIYLHGAAALGLVPGNCLALEDSPAGILSAYRAGCLPVMIPDQDLPDEKTIPLLYAKADSLADIVDLLKMR